MNYDERYKQYTDAIETALEGYVPSGELPQKKLLEAMRYSLLNGGKRLRPVMLLEFCRICGGNWKDALPFACALEMIHTYSLVHDDMPCMDNDDARRGKLSCHKAFGEATALLAGAALLSAAFETMLRPSFEIPPDRALRAAYILARASGLHGIAGGQELDLHHGSGIDQAMIHEMKTAAMFVAAAEAGCVIADSHAGRYEAAVWFATAFGLGFQFADDFEDSGGNEKSRVAALSAYGEAKEKLSAFSEASFLADMIDRLTAQLVEGENGGVSGIIL